MLSQVATWIYVFFFHTYKRKESHMKRKSGFIVGAAFIMAVSAVSCSHADTLDTDIPSDIVVEKPASADTGKTSEPSAYSTNKLPEEIEVFDPDLNQNATVYGPPR